MIISNDKDFMQASALINKIFNKEEFPAQVFRKEFTDFTFEEFDGAMTPEFWDTTIQKLAQTSHDQEIYVAVISPDPVSHYFHHFGYYNILKLPISASAIDYYNFLEKGPAKSPVDAMFYNSRKVVWIPLSGKWAIPGERSLCVCALGFAKDSAILAPQGRGWWRPASDALEELIDNNFRGRVAPKEFADEFLSNTNSRY